MNQSDIHFLDLPNEILVIILKKLDNINVLYSLMGVFNKRFDTLLEHHVFTNTLDLLTRSSTDDDIYSLDHPTLDRFCIDLLPKIHHNVKRLIFNSESMRQILVAGNYPQLTSLNLFHFQQRIALNYFTRKYLIYPSIRRSTFSDIEKENNILNLLCLLLFRSINFSTYIQTSNNRTYSSSQGHEC